MIATFRPRTAVQATWASVEVAIGVVDAMHAGGYEDGEVTLCLIERLIAQDVGKLVL